MAYKPEGHQDAIANLTFIDSKAATEFYKDALDASNVQIMESDTGWVMHGEMTLGDSVVFFNDEADFVPRKAPTGTGSVAFYLYVPDVDASYKKAVASGMAGVHEPTTMFWGDGTAVVTDPFHYTWTFSTKVASPSQDEMAVAQKAMFGGK